MHFWPRQGRQNCSFLRGLNRAPVHSKRAGGVGAPLTSSLASMRNPMHAEQRRSHSRCSCGWCSTRSPRTGHTRAALFGKHDTCWVVQIAPRPRVHARSEQHHLPRPCGSGDAVKSPGEGVLDASVHPPRPDANTGDLSAGMPP